MADDVQPTCDPQRRPLPGTPQNFMLSTVPDTPTGSPRKRAYRLPCSSSSFTSGSAVLSPTAASTTVPTPNTAQTASSKPPPTAPTKPSTTSSNCLPQPDFTEKSRTRFVQHLSG